MNVNYCLRRAQQLYGNNIAILDQERSVTYREFAAGVEHSARRFAGLGVKRGERVAVLLANSPAYLDLHFSVPKSGALIVPLNTRWNIAEMVGTLLDSGTTWLVVDHRFATVGRQLAREVPSLKGVLFYGSGECPSGLIDFAAIPDNLDLALQDPHEDDLVGLFYTSGSTGGPKGAMLTHRNLFSNALHSLLPPSLFEPDSRFLHAAPMFHLADIGAILGLTLTGGTHCFLAAFDPENAQRVIQEYRVSASVFIPVMLNMMLHHPSFGRYDLSSLKRLSYGGSPMSRPLLELAKEKLGCEFVQGYGMTELSPLVTVLTAAEHCLDDGYAAVGSAGRPVCGVDVRVVDHLDRDVPIGAVGEVIARGANVMKGYWNRPEISADALRGGWMHTGDMGRFDADGYLYILDRKKDMIKPGGENVYSPEVEATLAGHPAVMEVAVIGIPDPKWDEAVRAVVALKAGESLTEQDLIGWCRERLTHFKCPTSIVFVDSLPKGGTGKIPKNVLRERFGSRMAAKG
jgi:long-chain acyl-CoA synthetase